MKLMSFATFVKEQQLSENFFDFYDSLKREISNLIKIEIRKKNGKENAFYVPIHDEDEADLIPELIDQKAKDKKFHFNKPEVGFFKELTNKKNEIITVKRDTKKVKEDGEEKTKVIGYLVMCNA